MHLHPVWHEAAASVQSELDKDLRAEAYELFRAETARTRLGDRFPASGTRTRVTVRNGQVLTGFPAAAEHRVDGVVALVDAPGRVVLIPYGAVVSAEGLQPTLRLEDGPVDGWSVSARLRDAADMDEVVAVLLVTGARVAGAVVRVGADHVDLSRGSADVVTVAFAAVDAWYLIA